jgi:hypothetical protein
MREKTAIIAAICVIILSVNLVGWLIYDRGYSDGARIERRRCTEAREQERQLRHEARLDAISESADEARDKIVSDKK